MVNIIPRIQKPPKPPKQSFIERIGFPGILDEFIEKTFEAKKKREQAEIENKKIIDLQNKLSDLTGYDFTGVNDPKILQKAFELTYGQKAKAQTQFDLINQLGMGDIFSEKGKNLQGQFPGETSEITQLQGQKPEDEINVGVSRLPHSQADINKMMFIKPALANQWQKENEEAKKEARHREKMMQEQDLAGRKEVTESYKENQKYIDTTYDKYEDSLRRESILDKMDQLENEGKLSESGIINLLEQTGLNQEWLKNPSNEEYTKLALDLLGGGSLQADYGSRVLQSEFKVSMQRIPTLMQTPEGRKQIKENIRAMLLPSKLKQERLQYYLDKQERDGKPLPHDLRGKVLKDIKPQLEEAYDKFKQRNGRYKVKEGTFPDENVVEKYFYMSNGDIDKAAKMMEEDGYNVTPNKPSGISGGSARARFSK